MAIIAEVLNGNNLVWDFGLCSGTSSVLVAGVRQGYENECEVTTNSVASGMAFVEVTRDSVAPVQKFLAPVLITDSTVTDTTGDGYIILKGDDTKINSGEGNSEDGSGIFTIEKVSSLPSKNYLLLASLSSGSITDERNFLEIKENIFEKSIVDNLLSTDVKKALSANQGKELKALIDSGGSDLSTHEADNTNPHSVTKDQVGLGNVENKAQLKREAADFGTFSEKGTADNADMILIEDSADSYNKKYIKAENFGGGGGGGDSARAESRSSDHDTTIGNLGKIWVRNDKKDVVKIISPRESGVASAGTWSSAANYPIDLIYGAGCGESDDFLVFGNNKSTGGDRKKTYVFNGTSWARESDLSQEHSNAYGYGYGFGTVTAAVSIYYEVTETFDGSVWSVIAATIPMRSSGGACGTQSAGLICGGALTAGGVGNNVYSFDGSAYTTEDPLLTASYVGTTFGSQSSAVNVTGRNGSYQPVDTAEKYDGTSWSSTGSASSALAYLKSSGSSSDDGMIFTGLLNGSTCVDTVESFNGTTFAAETSSPHAVYGAAGNGSSSASAINVGGGETVGGYTRNCDIFTKTIANNNSYYVRQFALTTNLQTNETVESGDLVQIDDSTGKTEKANRYNDWVGIVQNGGAIDDKINIAYRGEISRIYSDLIPGRDYYFDSNNELTTSAVKYYAGRALSTTDLMLCKKEDWYTNKNFLGANKILPDSDYYLQNFSTDDASVYGKVNNSWVKLIKTNSLPDSNWDYAYEFTISQMQSVWADASSFRSMAYVKSPKRDDGAFDSEKILLLVSNSAGNVNRLYMFSGSFSAPIDYPANPFEYHTLGSTASPLMCFHNDKLYFTHDGGYSSNSYYIKKYDFSVNISGEILFNNAQTVYTTSSLNGFVDSNFMVGSRYDNDVVIYGLKYNNGYKLFRSGYEYPIDQSGCSGSLINIAGEVFIPIVSADNDEDTFCYLFPV